MFEHQGNNNKASFLRDVSVRIARIRTTACEGHGLVDIFREVHTIKGFSLLMGFADIAKHAHRAEECLPSFADAEKRFRAVDFFTCIAQIEAAASRYKDSCIEAEKTVSGLQVMVAPLRSRLDKLVQNSNIKFKSFDVYDEISTWNEHLNQVLAPILLHCLNNAIDHGYLIPSKSGTAINPVEISIRATAIGEDRLEVLIHDSGVGLQHNRLKSLAMESGLAEERYLEVLFLDGKSTAEVVTGTSGRGVGLGTARKIARDNGGDVVLSNGTHGGTVCKITLNALHFSSQ